MDIQEIFSHLEALFAKQDIQAVAPYLEGQLDLAYECKDYSACITIMNELIGFFRDTSQYQKSLNYSEQVLMLMQQLGYEGTLPYATTCLNVANALRAAGHHKESLAFYEQIFPIYQEHLESNDERFASLYNNLSLLYQEMGDFESAALCLEKALEIVSQGNDIIKVAITHSNMGASLLQLGKTEKAITHLEMALAIFNQSEEKDFHYNAAVAAMGQAYVALGRLEEARECYLEALLEQMKHCGKSEAFYRILDNLHVVEEALNVPLTEEPEDCFRTAAEGSTIKKELVADDMTSANTLEAAQKPQIRGLDLSEEFYECVAKESLFGMFTAFKGKMAIGLVGEGSECFGFDDDISTDHDFGPGFCIWLSRDDYNLIGKDLQQWYDSLPDTYMGYSRNTVNGAGRVGVWYMDDFFKHFTGYRDASEIPDENALMMISDEAMSTILNGRIFHDPSGVFNQKRLAFYNAFTEKLWQMKLAQSLIELGKYGQYNYPRSMKRGDYVTAQIVLYKYVEELLKFVHYINHVFPPYYKWLKKSASSLDKLAVLADLTEALADFADGREAWKEDRTGTTDKVVGTIEIIAKLIIEECKNDGLLEGLDLPEEELFLEAYGRALLVKVLAWQENTAPKNIAVSAKQRKVSPLTDELILANNTKDELVDYIVSLEWQAFDEVQNQGGRADCQDDWGTFSIMRKSQYLAWPKQLIISFIQDFKSANAQNWNLITEKYGRMMKTTDPAAYAEIQDKLPTLTETQESIIEQIVKLQVSWMEQFAAKYPHMASNSRSIHSQEDTPINTSYETYLRGELSTYSHETLKMYGGFVVQLAKTGQNMAQMIMTNTALLYGYKSLEDAEARLSGID